MFDTYGPYSLTSYDKAGIDALWGQFRSGDPSNIEHGVGIYLFCVERADANAKLYLQPWYVGQTQTSFGRRLKQHFDKGRFRELSDKGAVKILFISRAKDGRVITRRSSRQARLESKFIDWLEIDLIDRCRLINHGLMNKQFVRFLESIWVGGYRGENARDPMQMRTYPAYLALATLLKLNQEN